MIRKVPIIGSSTTLADFFAANTRFSQHDAVIGLEDSLRDILGPAEIFCFSSGIASFYMLLKVLSSISEGRDEVFIPAYTAGSLVTAIRKAGLIPRLYDISLDDYNGDLETVPGMVGSRTLAVVAVHMFGIGSRAVTGLRQKMKPGIALIEDCCQAMGSTIDGEPVGTWSDASFFSFNRGKALAVYTGGCIFSKDSRLPPVIRELCKEQVHPPGAGDLWMLPFQAMFFMIASRPQVYGLAHLFKHFYQSRSVPADFTVAEMTAFQAALGARLAARLERMAKMRHAQGMYLAEGLSRIKGIGIPGLYPAQRYNFIRFPLLVQDSSRIAAIQERLWKERGIESSRLYDKPLHHMFDLGYRGDDFANACFLADHLLTLPVHPFVKQGDLDAMIDTVSRTMKG